MRRGWIDVTAAVAVVVIELGLVGLGSVVLQFDGNFAAVGVAGDLPYSRVLLFESLPMSRLRFSLVMLWRD